MSMTESRTQAFKVLYSMEMQNDFDDESFKLFLEASEITKQEQINYIKEIIFGVKNNIEKIDGLISKNLLSSWKIERISKINLSILRLGIYEMLYKETPFKVVINECVELAKEYGDDNSQNFINGVFASIVRDADLI